MVQFVPQVPEAQVPATDISKSQGANASVNPDASQQSDRIPLRKLGINPCAWYVVAHCAEVPPATAHRPLGITLWHQPIVLYRDTQGTVHALEDRCPHRQVKLSSGAVQGDELECSYHGWRFGASGQCTRVPYLADDQKLPTCPVRTYPVREQDGFIWLWLGEVPDELPAPMGVPEWHHLNYISSFAVMDFNAHYSFLIENLMDMYHGHLHDHYQAWADPKLDNLEETSDRVHAHYQAQSYYTIDKIWSVSQLFIPALRRLHPEPLDVSYIYPHWKAALGQEFRIYCLFCPVDETRTRAYLLHFTSLEAFPRLHKLPTWFRRTMKNLFFNSARPLLNNLIRQDVLMMEQEQEAFDHAPHRKGVELNRAIASVQRVIRHQANH